ncbi:MAG: hypothetical protein M3256_26090 [Actinomycetota bacterium]|nr:hypothetical protein [Actinomycetota bacterium]
MAKKSSAAAKRAMSNEHKAALAEGREQGRAVRRYLEALEATKPRRGRKRTPAKMEKRLAVIEEALPTADPLSRVHLVQERFDLQSYLANGEDQIDLSALEAEFIDTAASYGERKGISYMAWREVGVAPRVLKAAGISRS